MVHIELSGLYAGHYLTISDRRRKTAIAMSLCSWTFQMYM